MTATTSARTSGAPPVGAPDRSGAGPAPAHTGSRGTRVLGVLALAAIGLLALYGLVISPPDREMDDAVRLFYVHVPSATYLYLGCVITTVASAMWLRRRTPGWDALAEAGAEVGLVFAVITLFTGSLWGRPTWGTYWTWDARLTSTAVLTALLVGYLALRRLDLDPGARSVRAAVLGLLLVPNVVIVNRSVEWWRSLHQSSTLAKVDPDMDGDMLVAAGVGFLAIGLVFTWLMVHRFRVAWLEQAADRVDLDVALEARRAEAADRPGGRSADAPTDSPADRSADRPGGRTADTGADPASTRSEVTSP